MVRVTKTTVTRALTAIETLVVIVAVTTSAVQTLVKNKKTK